jgi:hypothetical protein
VGYAEATIGALLVHADCTVTGAYSHVRGRPRGGDGAGLYEPAGRNAPWSGSWQTLRYAVSAHVCICN